MFVRKRKVLKINRTINTNYFTNDELNDLKTYYDKPWLKHKDKEFMYYIIQIIYLISGNSSSIFLENNVFNQNSIVSV